MGQKTKEKAGDLVGIRIDKSVYEMLISVVHLHKASGRKVTLVSYASDCLRSGLERDISKDPFLKLNREVIQKKQ